MASDATQLIFNSILCVGIPLLILALYGAKPQSAPKPELPFDERLRDRLQKANLRNWRALRRKSKLSYGELKRVREGAIAHLSIEKLLKLATCLDWNPTDLLQEFGVTLSPSAQPQTTANDQAALKQECDRLRQQLQQQQAQQAQANDQAALKQECDRLRQQLQQQQVQQAQSAQDLQSSMFEQLETLLTNYPSVRKSAQERPNLPARNLTALFTPLDNLIKEWGYEPIGTPWKQVAYDPQLHQAETNDIKPGEQVYVRFIGYRDGDRILCPAKVSRTLPKSVNA